MSESGCPGFKDVQDKIGIYGRVIIIDILAILAN
jgi:hypothetical protein